MTYKKNGKRVTLTPHNVPKYKELYYKSERQQETLWQAIESLCILVVVLIVSGILVYHSKNTEISLLRVQNQQELEKADQFARNAQMEYDYLYQIVTNPETKTPTEIIQKVFGKDAGIMQKVAYCESHLNPKAANKASSARGLFQIMASVHQVRESWLYDATINSLIAKKLFDQQGLTPWESSRSCWSK